MGTEDDTLLSSSLTRDCLRSQFVSSVPSFYTISFCLDVLSLLACM